MELVLLPSLLQILNDAAVDIADVFTEALAKADMKQETVAELLGISATQLSQQVHGRNNQHVSFNKLIRMVKQRPIAERAEGLRFLSALLDVVCERFGLNPDRHGVELMLRVAVASEGQLKMLKAQRDDAYAELEKRRA